MTIAEAEVRISSRELTEWMIWSKVDKENMEEQMKEHKKK